MIEHSVGVQVKEVIKVSKIDQDFFVMMNHRFQMKRILIPLMYFRVT